MIDPLMISQLFPRGTAVLAAASLMAIVGCGPAPAPPRTTQNPPPQQPTSTPQVRVNTGPADSGSNPGGYANAPRPNANGGGSQRQHRMEFLNRIRQADPQFKTIDRAVMNDQNELGLILDRSVNLDDVPKLLQAMLTQLAKEFPNEDHDVIAYTPSNPPLKVGSAHLDARTRQMTYTPARR